MNQQNPLLLALSEIFSSADKISPEEILGDARTEFLHPGGLGSVAIGLILQTYSELLRTSMMNI